MTEKKPLTESQKKAIHKYLSKFIEMKIRVSPDEHESIKQHASAMGESATAFMKRAVAETMERDRIKKAGQDK